jgi:Reverse transcriptase (RNA-dependent DNA polymerase)
MSKQKQAEAIALQARSIKQSLVARKMHDSLLQNFQGMMFRFQAEIPKDGGFMRRAFGPNSPLLSNIYLTEVDRMLERAKETTRNGKYTYVEYARFADDLVVLIDAHPRNAWLLGAVNKRLREEFAKLQVEINEEKSRFPTPAR